MKKLAIVICLISFTLFYSQINKNFDSINFYLKNPLLEKKALLKNHSFSTNDNFNFKIDTQTKSFYNSISYYNTENSLKKRDIFNPTNATNITSALVLGALNYCFTSFP